MKDEHLIISSIYPQPTKSIIALIFQVIYSVPGAPSQNLKAKLFHLVMQVVPYRVNNVLAVNVGLDYS